MFKKLFCFITYRYTKDAYQATMSSHYPIILTAITSYESMNNYAIKETDENLSEFVLESSCYSSGNTVAKTCHQDKCFDNCSLGLMDEMEPGHKSCLDIGVSRTNERCSQNILNRNSCVMVEKQGSIPNIEKFHEKQTIGHDFMFSRILPGAENNSNVEDVCSTDFDHPNKESVRLSLFELNHKAQQLLPFLIVGTKYDTKNSRIPEILFIEGDDIHKIKG